MTFKPMLSATCEDIAAVKYPVLVSPKLDGIRCIIRDGVAVSRNLKPIPNAYVQTRLKGLPDGLDGELIVGEPTGEDVWNRSNSGVMSRDGEPSFTFWVFDVVPSDGIFVFRDEGFESRIEWIKEAFHGESREGYPVELVTQVRAASIEQLSKLESLYVERGYEGVMLRAPNGTYKFGRSTVKEGGLMKVKRWHDAEAVIVDMVERMHNGNEATKDELGRTKRSTHKANKVGRGDMGALVCAFDDEKLMVHIRFELGTGFTDEQRGEMWSNRHRYIGRLVTYKYQALTPDGIPRFPVYKGLRNPGDL